MEESRSTRNPPSAKKTMDYREDNSFVHSATRVKPLTGPRHASEAGADEGGNVGVDINDDNDREGDGAEDDGEDDDDENAQQDMEYMRFLASMFTVSEEDDRFLVFVFIVINSLTSLHFS